MALNFITDFGGVGDGIANDSAAMKAAMEYAGDVFFPDPPAFYRLVGEINIATDITGKKYGNPPTGLTYGSLGELQGGTWTCFIKLDNSTRAYNNTAGSPLGHWKMFYVAWGKSITAFEFANFHISVIWETDPALALENKQLGANGTTWDYYRFSFWIGDAVVDGYWMHHCSWNFDDCWSGGPVGLATGDTTTTAKILNLLVEYNIFNTNQVSGLLDRTSTTKQPWDRITISGAEYRYNTCISQGNVGNNPAVSSVFVGITLSGQRHTQRMQGIKIHHNYMNGFGYSAIEHAYHCVSDFDCNHEVTDNIIENSGPQQGTAGNAITLNNYYWFFPQLTKSTTGGTINFTDYYYYKIVYVNALGESVPSPASQSLYVSAGSGTNSIICKWQTVPDTEGYPITGYKIYRRVHTVSTSYFYLADVPAGVGEITFIDDGSYTLGAVAPTTGLSWVNKFFRYKGFKFQRNIIRNSWVRDVFKDLDGALITDNQFIRTIDSTDLRLIEATNWKNVKFLRNILTYDTPRAWSSLGMSSFIIGDDNAICDNTWNITFGINLQLGKNNRITGNIINHANSIYAGLVNSTHGSIQYQSDALKYSDSRNNYIKNKVYLKSGSPSKSVYNYAADAALPIMAFDESEVYIGGVLQTTYPKVTVAYSAALTNLTLQNSELARTFTLTGSPASAWECRLPGRYGVYTITNSSGQACTISCYNGVRTVVIPAGETKTVIIDSSFNCDLKASQKSRNFNGMMLSA